MAGRRAKKKPGKKPGKAPTRTSLLRRFARACLRGLLLTVLAVALVTGALLAWSWQDVDAVASGPVTDTAFTEAFVEATGRRPKMVWRDARRIDPSLHLAVLVAEDARFFDHGAFDTRELFLALESAWRGEGRLRGASTLTQQLVKNLWLSSKRSMLRKVREAAYAVVLEHRVDKRRILELYLNVVEMGPGVFGAQAAAQRFFQTDASQLTPRQAAELAATLSRPSRWYPGVSSEGYERRVQHILREMERSPDLARALSAR